MTHFGTRASLFVALLALGAACSTSTTPPIGDAGPDAATDSGTDGAADSGADGALPTCPADQAPFEPGCGEGMPAYTPITAGCYQTCTGAGDTSCGAGLACARTVVNPCVCEGTDACCGACGAEQWLCLPPPPTDCSGRSYCDCSSGCEPLVDLSTGCICQCNAPFNCSGETCDCICGGATYLGCAPVGQCETTQIDCGPGCDVVTVDGCPACDPSCTTTDP
ncbi:MAG: hypothetical protein JRH11_06420 [Deltaproteobacteria bacterium]|nr:hypothetical protein [Deltaproteobacteria bacterium]